MSNPADEHAADVLDQSFWLELLQFVDEWWSTRPRGSFFGGTLILLLGGLLCGLCLVAVTCPDHVFVNRYCDAADSSCAAEDWSTAELMYRRLQDMEFSETEVQFGLARVAEELGDRATAAAWMEQLADSGKPGRARAHFWLAQRLVESRPALTADQVERLIEHLRQVLASDNDHRQARGMLGMALAGVGQLEEAAGHLKQVREDRIKWKMMLARVEARRGRGGLAAQYAKELVLRIDQDLQSKPDDVGQRLKLVEACLLSGDLSRAERVLVTALSEREQPALRQALARVYLAGARKLERDPHGDRVEALKLLVRAHTHDPNMPDVLQRLARHMGSQVVLPPQLISNLTKYLEHRSHQDQNDRQAVIALGQIAVRQGHDQQAIDYYQSVVGSHPGLHLEIARAHSRLGQTDAAQAAAAGAVRHFRQLAADDESGRARILWAHGEALRGAWPAAERVLRDGASRQPLPAYRLALANLYVNWAAATDLESALSRSRKFDLLLQALQQHPTHRPAMTRLAALVEAAGDSVSDLESRLQHALATGAAAPVLHEMLGTLAAQQARFETARFHLEQAVLGQAVRPQTLNNLAWVLMRCDQPDLERALALINQAQTLNPRLTELRETRGEILLKLERWAAAVSDLESVLKRRPKRSRLHALLAEAYDGLGDSGTADHHRRLAHLPVEGD